MLTNAFVILTVAVLLGLYLGTTHLGLLLAPSWMVGAVHGVIGVAGLATLVLALGGPARGVEFGVQSFGKYVAAIVGAALIGGLTIASFRLRARAAPGWLIAGHATVAIMGYAFLLAYISLG